MKKKLLVVLSLLSALTATTFGIGCAGDNKEESTPATSISSPAESEKESSENKTSAEEETTSEDVTSEESSTENTEPTLTLYQSSVSVEAYTSAALTAKLENSEETLVWASSDESVATVDNGVVFALKAGTVTITVTAGDLSASCEVTVTAASEAVAFVYEEEVLEPVKGFDEAIDLELEYKGEEFTLATFEFVTEGDVLTVSEEGVITVLAYGTQTITVNALVSGEVVATKVIEVVAREYGTIICDLPENKLDLTIGEEAYELTGLVTKINDVVVENPDYVIVSDNKEVVDVVNGKLVAVAAGTANVTVSYISSEATYSTIISVTSSKLCVVAKLGFLVKGDAGMKDASTGNATINLEDTGIDLSVVEKVVCGDTQVTFAVEGTNLTLTNAPAGDQEFVLITPTVDYVIDGCIYGHSIATAEEFIAWRSDVFYNKAYTILENDIDLEGMVLPAVGGEAQLSGVLDGRGYTISNFSYAYNYGLFYYINASGGIKNIQFVNVVQDCIGQSDDTHIKMGLLCDNLMGTVENVLFKVTIKNMKEGTDHYGLLAWYFAATGVMKNVVVYAEAVDCAPHYFYACAAGGADGCVIDSVYFVSEGTGLGLSGKPATNSGAYTSVENMLKEGKFNTWGGFWKVDANGAPYMSDYTDNEGAPAVKATGKATVGSTISFETTSFYPLTYTLSETAGITMNENNEVVIGTDAEIGATFTVTVTCEAYPEYSKTYTFELEKQAIAVEGVVMAKGNGGKWSYDTGVATLDFTGKGIDLSNVVSVKIDDVAFDAYTVDGNKLVVTNAPGGDHAYTISTASHTYTVTGCVYTNGISTVDELEAWRTSESYWYTVLLNDIDYNGATLTVGANVLGTLDGRGYQIKNFTYTQGFVKNMFDEKSAIKNVYFANATQDCTGMGKYPAYGLFGQWTKGTLENLYLDVTTTNLVEGGEHIATICYGLEATAKVTNIVLDLKSENGNFHYGVNQNNGALVTGVVGGYEGEKGSSEGGGAAWGVNGGFHAKLSWMIAEEANDELRSFTSAYWVIDVTARTITMKPLETKTNQENQEDQER